MGGLYLKAGALNVKYNILSYKRVSCTIPRSDHIHVTVNFNA